MEFVFFPKAVERHLNFWIGVIRVLGSKLFSVLQDAV